MNKDPSNKTAVFTPEEHGLKDLNEEQLFDRLMTADPTWSEEQRTMVADAYQLACMLHKDDKHRGRPYKYHLLRNANRITHYLRITDHDVIAAALLHDSVEDHPDTVIQYALSELEKPTIATSPVEGPVKRQQVALGYIEVLFSPRTAKIVRGMTNPPTPTGSTMNAQDKLQHYLNHVEHAIEDPAVWANKLADWVDNGLGIVHSDFTEDPDRQTHFMTKYGKVFPLLEARYRRADIQDWLDPEAKANVEQMFTLAPQRLSVQ